MANVNTADPQLKRIVDGIVSVHPHARILLFGSRARGTAKATSDFDLVIVTPDLTAAEPAAARVRKALRDVDASLDLIVLTPEEWEASRKVRGSVLREAAEHGVELYAAA